MALFRSSTLLLLATGALCSAATCPPLSLPKGWSLQTLGSRTFHLYLPASYDASQAVPLVVYSHGFTDSCTGFGGSCGDKYCGWPEESEARNFAFVSLCGDLGDASFNAGTCCPPANTFEVSGGGTGMACARAHVPFPIKQVVCVAAHAQHPSFPQQARMSASTHAWRASSCALCTPSLSLS